ncbi:hypothetical protein KKA13_00330 [Patescibacteria group bacterium]|nr:hypothetical protein [Patescibacteria group bacterium]
MIKLLMVEHGASAGGLLFFLPEKVPGFNSPSLHHSNNSRVRVVFVIIKEDLRKITNAFFQE